MILAGSFVLSACAPAPATESDPAAEPAAGRLPAASEFGELGAAGCAPASPIVDGEILGTPASPNGSAFGELQGPHDGVAFFAGDDPFKIVMRVVGEGDISIGITPPGGAVREPAWGPEPHLTSNYARPGDEWGMGLVFDEVGCWQVSVTRGGSPAAEFWIDVSNTAEP